ncbi:MAG: chemotaxis protein CheW [Gemmatimonadota bacterium]|nr:chemotaxis protein CheW [Gemmatimonadota bacterium]
MAFSSSTADDILSGDARELILRLGTRRVAVALAHARGVIPWRAPTRLPSAPPAIAGLINVRGSLVTVVDLGLHLTGVSCSRDEGSILLVVHRAATVGLAVDEVIGLGASGVAAGAERLDLDQLLAALMASPEEK